MMSIDAFAIKKIVSLLVHLIPGVPLAMLFALLTLNWLPKLSRTCLWCCTTVLLLLSSPFSSNLLVENLELRFQPLVKAPEDTRLILVLGSGHLYRSDRPDNSILSAVALSRLTEGIRLWKSHTDAILVTSGAQAITRTSSAEFSRSFAIEQGVPADQIREFDQVRDTEEEISMAADLLAKESDSSGSRLVIVSSATHLARAEQIVLPYEVTYTMAPTDYLESDAPWYRLDAENINKADRAIHEYMGMLWNWIRS